ncbi:MAG TPA: pentapeptide repeat-containing protein [Candidatus Acidoferrales bacterium]|nr:pentapeptide repeat-containing protein [Candidatus Acidoferrales bacterium]
MAVLLNSLWQGALIAFVAWGVLRIFSRANAATRYAIWALALAAMIVIPIFTSLPHVSVEAPPTHAALIPPAPASSDTHASAPAQVHVAHHGAARSLPFTLNVPAPQVKIPSVFALAVFSIWGIAALVVLGRLIFAIVSLEKLKRDSLPLDVAYRDQMPEWNAAVNGFRDVRICVSDAIEVPVAIGLFDAMILLPRRLVASLDPKEIDQIALHELGHLRRNDDWTNALQRIACSLMFFNPAAWFVSRQLDLEREVACDDYVLRTTGAARSYAFCLTRIAEVTSWPQRGVAAPGVFITRRNISIRIERLLRSGRTIGASIAPEIAATVAVALVLVSVLLRTMTPSVAYTLPASKDKGEISSPLIVKVIDEPAVHEKATQKVHSTATVAEAAHLRAVKPALPALPAMPHMPAKGAPIQKVAELPSMPNVKKIEQDADRAAADAAKSGEDIGTMIGTSVASAVTKAVTGNFDDVCTGCDYSGGDLRGHDFAHKNLSGANFQDTNLRGAVFDHAQLTGANFEDADLRDASFSHANLIGCNLEGARLAGAHFENARLTGCNVNARDLSPQQAREFFVSCTGCNFDGANLQGMDLRNLHIKGANLDGADLRGADLSGSSFMGVNFGGVRLDGAKLDGAKFYGCNFDGVDFKNVDVSKAIFFGSSKRDVQHHSFLQNPLGHGRAHVASCDAPDYAPA